MARLSIWSWLKWDKFLFHKMHWVDIISNDAYNGSTRLKKKNSCICCVYKSGQHWSYCMKNGKKRNFCCSMLGKQRVKTQNITRRWNWLFFGLSYNPLLAVYSEQKCSHLAKAFIIVKLTEEVYLSWMRIKTARLAGLNYRCSMQSEKLCSCTITHLSQSDL